MRRILNTLLLCAAPLLLPGCDDRETDPDLFTWDDFLASDVVAPLPDGRWMVEGDLVIPDEPALRAFYERHYAAAPVSERAWVNTSFVTGTDIILDVARKLEMTYCVSDDFGADKANIVARMQQAALDWERATDVNYIYRPAFDSDCTTGNADHFFAVVPKDEKEPFYTASTCAHAFGPGEPNAADRLIRVYPHAFADAGCRLNTGGLMRHELGHTLGLAHEHERFAGGLCDHLSGSAQHFLSEPDFRSVMSGFSGTNIGCNGTVPLSTLSRRDATGVKFLYSLARDNWLSLSSSTESTQLDDGRGRDIYWYTPDSTLGDTAMFGQSDGTVTTVPVATPSPAVRARPIVGRFSPDSLSDVLFYSAGAEADPIYIKDASPQGAFTTTSLTIAPTWQSVIGNFSTSGRTDIVWYGPGAEADNIYESTGTGPAWFTPHSTTLSLGTSTDYCLPIAGDFDGDSDTDIFCYNPDSDTTGSTYRKLTGAFAFASSTIDHFDATHGIVGDEDSQFFYTAAVGDFNGDDMDDIFWYSPGAPVTGRFWKGDNVGDPFSATVVQSAPNTIYKVFTGDFDGNGKTDLFWYDQVGDNDFIWMMNGTSFAPTVFTTSFGMNDFNPRVADYSGDGMADIYLWDPVGDDKVWRSNGDGTFTLTHTLAGPAGYPVGYGQG